MSDELNTGGQPPAPSPAPAPSGDNYDVGAIVREMGSLFSPSPSPSPEPSPPAPQLKPLPKAWKKEMEAHWSKLDPTLHDYIYEREGDVSRGIQMYKTGHENWSKLVTPYNQLLQQHPDVNPVELMSNLMRSHIQLSFGNDQERKALFKSLMSAYRITPEMLAEAAGAPNQGSAPNQPPAPNSLEERLNTMEQREQQRVHAENLKLVQNFFNDPKNEFAQELGDDILKLVQRGFDLQQAYETAMWTNPGVREKVLAKQKAASAPAPGADALNIKAGNTGARSPSAPRQGTIDDTINGVIAKHYSGAH